jgi:hypothetical protein
MEKGYTPGKENAEHNKLMYIYIVYMKHDIWQH